jgi:hypothetical protein
MEIPENYTNKFTKGRNDERAALIGEITELTNTSRKRAGYKPWSERTVAVKLSPLKPTALLKDHFFECYKNEIFDSKKFWGKLKVK